MCENDSPKIIFDRGYRTVCCESHAKQIADETNAKKNNKLSKSQVKNDKQ